MTIAAAFPTASIVEVASLLVLAFTLWRISRGGGGSAVQELSEANRVLERRNHELGAEVRDLRIQVAELKTRTDFAAAMAGYEEQAEASRRVLDQQAQQRHEQHERRAEQRSQNIVRVLDLIAARLGPEAPL